MNRVRLYMIGALSGSVLAAAAAAVLTPLTPASAAARRVQHVGAGAGNGAASDSGAAVVPATETLGASGAWSAYASRDPAGRVCYLAGQPRKSEPGGMVRRQPMAMVTHRPAENIANVVSFVEGYPLKPDSEVALDVGRRKFALFTKDDSAWARTSELDRTIVATLARSTIAIVKGIPEKGPPTTDIYSLAGFDKALALIDKACGIKRQAAAAPSRPSAKRLRAPAPRRHPKPPKKPPRPQPQQSPSSSPPN